MPTDYSDSFQVLFLPLVGANLNSLGEKPWLSTQPRIPALERRIAQGWSVVRFKALCQTRQRIRSCCCRRKSVLEFKPPERSGSVS